MEFVKERNTEAMLPIIRAVGDCKPIIHSHERRPYSTLQRSGFKHRPANGFLNFVQPVTGIYTKNKDSY